MANVGVQRPPEAVRWYNGLAIMTLTVRMIR
jgi:hypothetical protein